MRDEFYGDRKDLWKWSVVLDEAGVRKILYVAMYRPDVGPKRPHGIRGEVKQFFENEWREVGRDRRCSRITQLCPERIVPFFGLYQASRADDYFSAVRRALEIRPRGVSYVVFVDPDTGILEKRGPRHLCPDDISLLWAGMAVGDSLLIYQHFAHQKVDEWVLAKTRLIASATGSATSTVRYRQHAGVCFFISDKAQSRD